MSKLIKKNLVKYKKFCEESNSFIGRLTECQLIQSYSSLELETELGNRTSLQLWLHKMLHELPTMKICKWNLVNCVSL